MRILLIVFVIFSIINSSREDAIADAMIQQFFEMLRATIKNGNPQNDVPVLDPLQFGQWHVAFENEIFGIDVNLTNGRLNGLGDFKLHRSEFRKEDISVNLKTTFPLLSLKAEHYDMDGIFKEFLSIAGTGQLYFEIHNLTIWCRAYLQQSDDEKSILFGNLENTQFSVDKIISITEFDHNIDEIVNAMVEDLLAGYFSRFNKYLALKYEQHVVDIMNPTLDKLDSWHFIAHIL